MSATQIMAELPKLTREEFRKVSNFIWEIDPDREVYAAAVENAEAGFLMLDAMEEEAAHGSTTA